MHVQYELLCGGPLDGLPVPAEGQQLLVAGEAISREYPGGVGARYTRRYDGRLHWQQSNWDDAKL